MKKILLILSCSLILSCETEKPKIEKGDIVSICIIDSVWFEPSKSTLDFEGKFNYITSCGNKLTTRGKQYYQKGDTITFVKKVKK